MHITQKAEGSCELSIEGELTIYRATEFHELLKEKQEKYQTICLDMENVSEIDTSCFQVMLYHKLRGLESNQRLELVNASEPVQELLKMYGVRGVFLSH